MDAWWKIAIESTTDVELVVARRTGGRSITAGTISINRDVADELRGIVVEVLDRMHERLTAQHWSSESSWEAGEYQIVPRGKLDAGNPLLDALEAEAIPDMAPGDLRDPSLLLYAIVVGGGAERLLFIRKTNPRYSAETRLFAVLGREHLSRVQQPLFSFDRQCDMILVPQHGLIAFTENPFDLLFRDSPELRAGLAASATMLAPNLMASEAGDVLAAAAAKWARVRRKIRAISERGHLDDVTPEQLVREFARLGYNPDDYLPDGKLIITATNVQEVVRILNEDVFQGGLSRSRFEAERKRAV